MEHLRTTEEFLPTAMEDLPTMEEFRPSVMGHRPATEELLPTAMEHRPPTEEFLPAAMGHLCGMMEHPGDGASRAVFLKSRGGGLEGGAGADDQGAGGGALGG